MKYGAYSLIEVMVASAIVAVGLSAAAVLVGTLMRQQELNAGSLRAANLQEQAVRLYRLEIDPDEIPALLPEITTGGVSPPARGYAIGFTPASTTNILTADGSTITVEVSACTLVYPDPAGGGPNVENTVTVVRPGIRASAE